MSSRLRIGISEFCLAEPPAVLVTFGLGSCLAITLYDPGTRFGAMAHTLLPASRSQDPVPRPAKFVDSAIDLMVGELLARGAERERLAAKLFGGANMFEPLVGSADNGIGPRNTRSAREHLAAQGIPLAAADVGGNFGRTVEFDLATGLVRVHVVRGREEDLVF